MNPKKRLLEPKETSPFAYLITFFRKLCPFSPFLNHLLKFSKNNRGRVINAMTFPLFGELQPLLSTNSATSFSQRSHFILSNKVPHSSYEYTSSSQRSRIFKPTKSYLRTNEVISSNQRSRIFKPTQSNLQVSAVISSSQRSHIFEPRQSYLRTNAVISSSQQKPLTFL